MERSGTRILTMAANTINRSILRELSKGPMQLEPGGVEARITQQGRELLFIAFVLERWLQKSPKGPLAFGSDAAKSATAGLSDSWATTMLHSLAPEPMTLTDLERAVGVLSRSSLERYLKRMERAGQIEAHPSDGEGALYAVTDWLREGIAPLAAASRWERRYAAEDTPPITPLDVEAAFVLTLPLLKLPGDLSGLCRLSADVLDGEENRPVGAMARVEEGRVVSCAVRLREEADARASGPTTAWLDAVIDSRASRLITEGDERLVRAVLDGLHELLFGIPVQ